MNLDGTRYIWEYNEDGLPEEEDLRLALDCPSWVAKYLAGIGVLSPDAARAWLDPRLVHLPAPEELPHLDRAAQRVCSAIQSRETIAVYGDYDVDGLTATFVLSDFLARSGAKVLRFIPDRLLAGYGMHSESIHELHRKGARLLITVDCGISNHQQIEEANRLGIDVVVTDHHIIPDVPPPAYAIVNPKMLPQEHPLFNLAGVGVAFYLAVALRSRLRACGHYNDLDEPNLREYMDLAALGTVADMMPLQGVNRVLVRHGLQELSRGSRIAVEALRRVVGQRDTDVTPWDIHFRYAPRINAASRMGQQDLVLEWLSSRAIEDASSLALRMEQLNRERAALEGKVFRDAVNRIQKDRSLQNARALVLAQEDWHAGILGIVASRIVEYSRKPAILLTRKGEHWEGSGRSLDGFHMHRALQQCAPYLDRFGGHALAVGLKLSINNLAQFRARIEEYAARELADFTTHPRLQVHAPLSLSEVNEATMAWLDRLGPFGQGCPEPVFWAESVDVLRQETIQDQHIRFMLGHGRRRFSAIAFRLASYLSQPVEHLERCAFVPMRNVWGGQSSIQLRILDFKAPSKY